MPKANPWGNNVPRIEIDYRAREARLRSERMEQLFAYPRAKRSWLRRVFFALRLGRSRYRSRAGQNNGSLRARQPRLRHIHPALPLRGCNHLALCGSLRDTIPAH